MNDNLMNNRFFNVHNGINLAGYGYFPPLAYQALTTQVDVEKHAIDGTALHKDQRREFMHGVLYLMIALLFMLTVVS